MSKEIAQTIMQQLGGKRFSMMTGAHSYSYGKDKNENVVLSFRLRSNPKRIFGVRITLTPEDLYDMEFLSMKGYEVKIASECRGVYADMLQSIFTEHTGLYTSL